MTDGLVLVIEDEDAIREMVRVTLESASFEVLEADSRVTRTKIGRAHV